MNSIKINLPAWRKYLSRFFLLLILLVFLGCYKGGRCDPDDTDRVCGKEVSVVKGSSADPIILTDKKPTLKVVTGDACSFVNDGKATYEVFYRYLDIPLTQAEMPQAEKDKPPVTVKFGTVEGGYQKEGGGWPPVFYEAAGFWWIKGAGQAPNSRPQLDNPYLERNSTPIPAPIHWVLNVTIQRPLISLPGKAPSIALPFIGQITGPKPRDVAVMASIIYREPLTGGVLMIYPLSQEGEAGKDYTFTAKVASLAGMKARYEWSVDGTLQKTETDVIKVNTSIVGPHYITCKVYDPANPGGKAIAESGGASILQINGFYIFPPSLEGEPGKDYSFTAKMESPPAKARYEWSVDGTLQETETYDIEVNTSKAGPHPITCKLYDAAKPGSKAIAEASATLTIKGTALRINPAQVQGDVNDKYTFTAIMLDRPSKPTYEWYFDDKLDTTGKTKDYSMKFTTAGSHTVSVKVSDEKGNAIGKATAVIEIKAPAQVPQGGCKFSYICKPVTPQIIFYEARMDSNRVNYQPPGVPLQLDTHIPKEQFYGIIYKWTIDNGGTIEKKEYEGSTGGVSFTPKAVGTYKVKVECYCISCPDMKVGEAESFYHCEYRSDGYNDSP